MKVQIKTSEKNPNKREINNLPDRKLKKKKKKKLHRLTNLERQMDELSTSTKRKMFLSEPIWNKGYINWNKKYKEGSQ